MLSSNGNVTMAEDLGDTDEEPPLVRERLHGFSRFPHRNEITDQHVSVRQLQQVLGIGISWISEGVASDHGTMLGPMRADWTSARVNNKLIRHKWIASENHIQWVGLATQKIRLSSVKLASVIVQFGGVNFFEAEILGQQMSKKTREAISMAYFMGIIPNGLAIWHLMDESSAPGGIGCF